MRRQPFGRDAAAPRCAGSLGNSPQGGLTAPNSFRTLHTLKPLESANETDQHKV